MEKLDYLNSRRDLYRYFTLNINQAYRSLREKMKLDRVKKLKVAVVEFNMEDVNKETLLGVWEEFGGYEIIDIDEDLFGVRVKTENHILEFFWETINSRIAYIYTLEDAKEAGVVIDNLTKRIYEIDSAWYTHDFLNSIPYDEERYIHIGRDPRIFYTKREKELYEHMSSVSITMRGTDIRNNPYITKEAWESLPLQSMDVRWIAEDHLISAHVDYSGRFSIIGTLFPLAKRYIDGLTDDYLNILKKIEDEILISYVSTDKSGFSLRGDTIILYYDPHVIRDAGKERLVRRFTDGTQPFRLIGDAYKMGSAYFISATDLHFVGDINISIYDDGIEISARKGSCGNTLLRFITNLTHALGLPKRVEMISGGKLTWVRSKIEE